MKKIKFLGTAILAASLLFAGCSSPVEDVVTEEDTSVTLSPEETGSNSGTTTGGTTTGGSTTGGTSNGGSTGGIGSGGSSTGGNEVARGITVSFSDTDNTVTSADGVYTINLTKAHGADDQWGNQIFITGFNEATGIANGDKIKTTATVKADKAITTFFFKNQFHEGAPHPGIDTSTSLEADTEKTVDIYGTVYDYNETSLLVIAIRGNEANTTLTLKDVKVEKLSDYAITSVSVEADSDSIAAGETTSLTATDQFGFVIADATFEITSDNPVSSISGNTLTAGDTAEEITVVAKKGEITSNPLTIRITAEKNYAKYWNLETTGTGEDAAPKDYFSIWADNWWCGSKVTLSDMGATATGVTLTQTVEGDNWFGTQIWYGLSQTSNLSFKVTSTVAGDISINIGEGNVVYALEAGVEKEFSFENVTGKLAIRLGAEATNTWLGDCTFTISDFSVTPASAAE